MNFDTVEGMLEPGVGECLQRLAFNCIGSGVIVEIGTWKGKSTLYLALGSSQGRKITVYTIDPHLGWWFQNVDSLTDLRKNIKESGLDDLVVAIITTSMKALGFVTLPIELLFIDGDHIYEAIRDDFTFWSQRVVKNGVIAIHDVNSDHPGVTQVYNELVVSYPDVWKLEEEIASLRVIRKLI